MWYNLNWSATSAADGDYDKGVSHALHAPTVTFVAHDCFTHEASLSLAGYPAYATCTSLTAHLWCFRPRYQVGRGDEFIYLYKQEKYN